MMPSRRLFLAGAATTALAARARASVPDKPAFGIGVIADSQYADAPDEPPHFYRDALSRLQAAIDDFNSRDLKFVAHLGDFIDRDWTSYEAQRAIKAKLRHPWHFVLGNHDFNVADEKKTQVPAEQNLGICAGFVGDVVPQCSDARYYTFDESGWRFVVLDGNDMSTYAWPKGSAGDIASRKIHDEKFPAAKPWNGGIGEEQMQWLDEILAGADAAGTPAMLLCHFPIWPENDPDILLWNAAEVVALIERHHSVKIWLNGHEHRGGYAVKNGIHYLNLKGMLDTEQTAYAAIDFYRDRLEVRGMGREESRTLKLR
jgi:manganese-dependent ADP-ribose/CDP-alcohol diphosphatase